MTVARVLYGLDRVPVTLAAGDVRLPGVDLGPVPLRLNSVPLPASAWATDVADHAGRMAVVRDWLLGACGDYNEALRRGVVHYLDAIAAHVSRHHDVLSAGLARYHGLYRVEDWCWSALRPLPRALWLQGGSWRRAELVFWNGQEIIETPPRDLQNGELPAPLQRFWNGETLPVSPFRRAFPIGPDGPTL